MEKGGCDLSLRVTLGSDPCRLVHVVEDGIGYREGTSGSIRFGGSLTVTRLRFGVPLTVGNGRTLLRNRTRTKERDDEMKFKRRKGVVDGSYHLY